MDVGLLFILNTVGCEFPVLPSQLFPIDTACPVNDSCGGNWLEWFSRRRRPRYYGAHVNKRSPGVSINSSAALCMFTRLQCTQGDLFIDAYTEVQHASLYIYGMWTRQCHPGLEGGINPPGLDCRHLLFVDEDDVMKWSQGIRGVLLLQNKEEDLFGPQMQTNQKMDVHSFTANISPDKRSMDL